MTPRPFKHEYPTICTRCGKEVTGKKSYNVLVREITGADNGVKIKKFIDLCPFCFGGFEKFITRTLQS